MAVSSGLLRATRPDYNQRSNTAMDPFRPFRLLSVLRYCFPRMGWIVLLGVFSVQAKIQFDVFPGYGDLASGVVRAGAWYPVGIEVLNDGPAFDAVVELSAGQFGGATQRVPIELPSNTRKRFVVPFFCASSGMLVIDARLYERGGKLRDERPGTRLAVVQWETPLLGALPGSFGGVPTFPTLKNRQQGPEWLPTVARLQPDFIPDNPIALEGLNAIYLNTSEVLKLKEPQANALLAWLNLGGHLIVAVDQAADLNAATWLNDVLPATVGAGDSKTVGKELNAWVRSSRTMLHNGLTSPMGRNRSLGNRMPAGVSDPEDPFGALTADFDFNVAPQVVQMLAPKPGSVVSLRAGTLPLVVTRPLGRGQVTLLAVNTEREPFRSWTLRGWFWARLCDVPQDLLRSTGFNAYGGRSLDGIFGSMIETRQIRKLPIGFLLLLLVVYLVVIGPLDQWWLRKINRPILTWITFPVYVVLFSLLIYFIGFKLRAGLTEWNELHVVDLVPQGDGSRAILRGHSFASIYSPRNETYRVSTDTEHGSLRAEFQGLWGNGSDNGRISLRPKPAGFEAEIFVPVWTSQLTVSEWMETTDAPLSAELAAPTGRTITVSNRTGNRMGPVWVVAGGQVRSVPTLDAHATVDIALNGSDGSPLTALIGRHKAEFQNVVTRRQEVFGSSEKSHIDEWPEASLAASFGSQVILENGDARDFVWPPGVDLTPLAQRQDVLVLAWMPDTSLIQPLSQFQPKLGRRATLLRLSVPARP